MKCALDGCNNEARRKFCCNKHKDRFHNLRNPRGRFAHLKENKDRDQEFEGFQEHYYSITHPFSGEALGQD
jgi:hypothetical protein